MKGQYLGDSYDAVKRLWQEVLAEWVQLYAEPRFIPGDIRSKFTAFTRIPLLNERRPTVYAILNDPDTGIRLPKGRISPKVGPTSHFLQFETSSETTLSNA